MSDKVGETPEASSSVPAGRKMAVPRSRKGKGAGLPSPMAGSVAAGAAGSPAAETSPGVVGAGANMSTVVGDESEESEEDAPFVPGQKLFPGFFGSTTETLSASGPSSSKHRALAPRFVPAAVPKGPVWPESSMAELAKQAKQLLEKTIRVEQLERELAGVRAARDESNADLNNVGLLEESLVAARLERDDAERRCSAAKKLAEDREADCKKLTDEMAELNGEMAKVEKEKLTAEKRCGVLSGISKAYTSQINELNAAKAAVDKRVVEINNDVLSGQKREEQLQKLVDERNDEIAGLHSEHHAIVAEHDADEQNLNSILESTNLELQGLAQVKAELEDELEHLRGQINGLESQIRQLQADNQALSDGEAEEPGTTASAATQVSSLSPTGTLAEELERAGADELSPDPLQQLDFSGIHTNAVISPVADEFQRAATDEPVQLFGFSSLHTNAVISPISQIFASTSTRGTQTPAKSSTTSTRGTQTPAKSSTTSTRATQTPVKSSTTSTRATQTPTKSSTTSTRATQTAAQRITTSTRATQTSAQSSTTASAHPAEPTQTPPQPLTLGNIHTTLTISPVAQKSPSASTRGTQTPPPSTTITTTTPSTSTTTTPNPWPLLPLLLLLALLLTLTPDYLALTTHRSAWLSANESTRALVRSSLSDHAFLLPRRLSALLLDLAATLLETYMLATGMKVRGLGAGAGGFLGWGGRGVSGFVFDVERVLGVGWGVMG